MKNINIYLIVDEFDTHRDLFCKIPKLDIDLCLDSYYFHFLFYDPETENNKNTIDVRRKVVKYFLANWYSEFEKIKPNKLLILPIGIHDEYLDIIEFKLLGKNECEVKLSSTRSLTEGFDIMDVNTYYINDSICYSTNTNTLIFNYNELLSDLKESIDKIDTCQIKESQLKPRYLPGVTIIYPKDK
ncbi:MAG: hypothetical protein ABI851_15835 [Saprospiraceae bacterium]